MSDRYNMASASGSGDPKPDKKKAGRPKDPSKMEELRICLRPDDRLRFEAVAEEQHFPGVPSEQRRLSLLHLLDVYGSGGSGGLRIPTDLMENTRFRNIGLNLGHTSDRETLQYLMDLEEQFRSGSLIQASTGPEEAASEPSASGGTATSAKKTVYAGATAAFRAEQEHRKEKVMAERETKKRRAEAALVEATTDFAEEIDDQDCGADAWEYDDLPDEEEESGYDPTALAEMHKTYEDLSFNLTDHAGNIGSDAMKIAHAMAKQDEWRDNVQKAKEQEPMLYDYSESRRLLPEGYYEQFSKILVSEPKEDPQQQVSMVLRSKDMECFEYVPKEASPDKYGFLAKQKMTVQERWTKRRAKKAIDIVNDGRWIVEFSALLKLINPKCRVADCDGKIEAKDVRPQRFGAVLQLTMTCNGIHRHKAVWYSSRQLWHNDDNRSRTFSVNALNQIGRQSQIKTKFNQLYHNTLSQIQ